MLTHKIDFAVILSVTNANPNGDPLNGNRPRTTYDGRGEISDVCLKRKIRNRLLDAGEAILVQSDDYRNDEYRNIKQRCESVYKIKDEIAKGKKANAEVVAQEACSIWYDVRAFGMVLALKDKAKGKERDNENSNGVSVPVRGPVSIQSAFSVELVDVTSLQITKSVNLSDEDKMGSDRMGMKHRIDKGVYVTFGSINKQLAEKTGFSDNDALKLKQVLTNLFENDESSARPAGSMEVMSVVWWTHDEKILPSAVVHRSLHVNKDGSYELDTLDGVIAEVINGK
jgi:CRISPR-associated protein Csd2